MQFLEITSDFENIISDYPINPDIPRITANNPLTYDEFFNKYMRPNQPVILEGLATNWECFQHWTKPENGQINCNYLKEKFKVFTNNVPVADCAQSKYNAHIKLDMKFAAFIEYWSNRMYSPTDASRDERLLYLKDWHLRNEWPSYNFYETPTYFQSDWLNEYLVDTKKDDYMFVYMGPKGTWTPFHADVFGSFSWSTNIAGTKHWTFLPPGEELKLIDRLGNLPFTVDTASMLAANVKHFEIEQAAGETVFVPSGWFHQVRNVADTISINHNWFNACNVLEIWTNMKECHRKVEVEIDDCRDMDDFLGHCQVMLKAAHGMNYGGFIDLLANVAKRRMLILTGDTQFVINGSALGRHHCLFDLNSIRMVINDFLSNHYGDGLEELNDICTRLVEQINDVLTSDV